MNKVILIGKLVKDPMVYAEGKVAKFKLSTRIGYDLKKQEEKIAFVPITAFSLSRAQLDNLKQGITLGVEGVVVEVSSTENNHTVFQTEVQVSKGGVRFL